MIILQIPFTDSVPIPHVDSVVSSAIGSGVYCIDCVCPATDFSATICFSNGINSSIVWDTAVMEGSDAIVVWVDWIVGEKLFCCSEVYPVSPVYFLIIDLSWM